MLFQPVAFITAPETPPSQSYAAHASSGNEQTTYTFSGVALGAAAIDRRILMYYATGDKSADVATLDGVGMTYLDGRGFIIDKPTGTTGSFSITLGAQANFCSIVVFAIYGISSLVPYDIDYCANTNYADIHCKVDVPNNGVVLAHYSAHGNLDDSAITVTNGPTQRLNTTVDGRRVWAGSADVASAYSNYALDISTAAQENYGMMISFGPDPISQILPSQLGSNLLGWWDPSDVTNRVLVSGKVYILYDKSGNARTMLQGNSTYRPTLVGNYMYMDGSNDYLSNSFVNPGGGANLAVWIVADMQDGAEQFGRLFSFQDAFDANDYEYNNSFGVGRATLTDDITIFRDGTYHGLTDLNYNEKHVICAFLDGQYGSIFEDIIEAPEKDPSSGNFRDNSGTVRTGAGPGGTENWKGNVGEIIFAKNVTRTQVRGISTYLKAKWGL